MTANMHISLSSKADIQSNFRFAHSALKSFQDSMSYALFFIFNSSTCALLLEAW